MAVVCRGQRTSLNVVELKCQCKFSATSWHTHTHMYSSLCCLSMYPCVCVCECVGFCCHSHIFSVLSVCSAGAFPFALWKAICNLALLSSAACQKLHCNANICHHPVPTHSSTPYLHLHWSRQCALSPTIRLTLNCLWQIASTVQRAEKML